MGMPDDEVFERLSEALRELWAGLSDEARHKWTAAAFEAVDTFGAGTALVASLGMAVGMQALADAGVITIEPEGWVM